MKEEVDLRKEKPGAGEAGEMVDNHLSEGPHVNYVVVGKKRRRCCC